VADMAEVVTVADHERAVAIVRLLKAKGVHEVGFWPKDMLDSGIGIIGGTGLPFPLMPPYRFQARAPAGPYVVAAPKDLAPLARHYLESPSAEREIARLCRRGWFSRLIWR
jgi:hypothetical protein